MPKKFRHVREIIAYAKARRKYAIAVLFLLLSTLCVLIMPIGMVV